MPNKPESKSLDTIFSEYEAEIKAKYEKDGNITDKVVLDPNFKSDLPTNPFCRGDSTCGCDDCYLKF